jgi:hypothetical protein
MSINVSNYVWKCEKLIDAVQVLILLCLANHADHEGGNCWPSVQTIAREIRQNERTVRRGLRALELGGWIHVKRGTGRRTSRYTIDVARLKQGAKMVPPVQKPFEEGLSVTPGGTLTTAGVTLRPPRGEPAPSTLQDRARRGQARKQES